MSGQELRFFHAIDMWHFYELWKVTNLPDDAIVSKVMVEGNQAAVGAKHGKADFRWDLKL